MTRSFDQYLASIRVPTPDAPEADAANNYAARLIRDGAIFVPGGSK